jgi:transcriptional regulator with XRE-family HTH domain
MLKAPDSPSDRGMLAVPEDAVANRAGKRHRLAQRRKALGLTQEALAGLLAVERSTVVRWERGETEPSPRVQPKLAKALQVSPELLEELLVTGDRVNPGAADRGPGSPRPRSEQILAMESALDLDASTTPVTGQVTTDWGRQPLEKAGRDLATAVTRQWTEETVMRSLGRPEPIQLRWSSTRRAAALASSAMAGQAPGPDQPSVLDLHGGLSDLVATFRLLPKRQLVVLGEPGAGKTALVVLLTLSLLSDPEPGDPIPVLLPLSSWDPRSDHLYTWLASRLTEEYPGLGNAAVYGPHAAKRLVAEGRVLPVLDGLDEMPPELQPTAIDTIDRATSGGRPLVLTCRSAEYEQAVLRERAVLAAAAVVEMEPVGLDDAARFLTARQPHGDSRWQPVIEHLRCHSGGPLAHVMSTPLMVDLARTAYGGPASDPAELIDTARFPDRRSIEDHLLGTFLPAAYPRRLPPLTPTAAIGHVRTLHPYDPEHARRWLTFLARHLQHTRSRDIAWWQLADAVPPFIRGLIFGLPPALLCAVTGELAGGPAVGIVYGVSFALAGFITNSVATRPGPLRVELRFRDTGRRFLGRFTIGVVIGVAVGLGFSVPPGIVLLLGLVFGLSLGVQVWLDTPADINRVSSPLTVLRQERLAGTWFTLTFALSLGTFYAAADTFTQRAVFLPVFGRSFDIALGLVTGIAGALLGRFAFGRTGSAAYGLATFAMGGMIFPPADRISAGFLNGAMFGIAAGLSIFLCRAWGSFILARIWFAARGQLPLRLTRFLDDAHRRSVLKQAGGLYQFRHARLQDNLAIRA